MKLSKKTTVLVNSDESNIIGHMTYAASKLWNVCNYERYHYKELGRESAPSWYSQKKDFKDSIWFKSLPSQTAQEVCKILDKSWKSFYALKKSGEIKNPRPPKYKQDNLPITYMQNGIRKAGDTIRLTISKALKAYMRETYAINVDYLYLRNSCFKDIECVKQLRLYPPQNGKMDVIIVYEIPDVEMKPNNGKYLSIDIGVHNLMTCYSTEGDAFILGRKYFSISRKYDKELARVQAQWSKVQADAGVAYPKSSKHIKALYAKKKNCLNDYLHKLTHWLAEYCEANDIHTVVLGDITGIRDGKNMGHTVNQEFHALPYQRIRELLSYKLAMRGITIVIQNEAYSSQCSPLSPEVSKTYAEKDKRVQRGLYKDGHHIWNADVVGAYNILRLHLQKNGYPILSTLQCNYPHIVKVAV